MKEVKIEWRGTWGVGDFMMALNCAHRHSWNTDCLVNLEMHWAHSEDYYHHFEEEETIIERMEYVHRFYHQKNRVRVTHKFNQREGSKYFYSNTSMSKNKNRYHFEDGFFTGKEGDPIPDNDWLFRPLGNGIQSFFRPNTTNTKVVIWRPLFNSQVPRTWKRLLTNDDWDVIITKLRQAGLHVVELTYRTPIREAMFHILTCRLTVSYCGMWHYITKNAGIPSATISTEGITKYHSSANGLIFSHEKGKKESIWFQLDDMHNFLGKTKVKSINYVESHKNCFKYSSLQEMAARWRS